MFNKEPVKENENELRLKLIDYGLMTNFYVDQLNQDFLHFAETIIESKKNAMKEIIKPDES